MRQQRMNHRRNLHTPFQVITEPSSFSAAKAPIGLEKIWLTPEEREEAQRMNHRRNWSSPGDHGAVVLQCSKGVRSLEKIWLTPEERRGNSGRITAITVIPQVITEPSSFSAPKA